MTLSIELRGVVRHPEEELQQPPERDEGGVVGDLDARTSRHLSAPARPASAWAIRPEVPLAQ
jgi:hypothetical protein